MKTTQMHNKAKHHSALRALDLATLGRCWRRYRHIMNRVVLLLSSIFLIFGCSNEPQELTPEMRELATATVVKYLNGHNLPNENLEVSISQNRDIADFSFMYKGGGRCINFIVKCYGSTCTELQSYPYDRHGEKCP